MSIDVIRIVGAAFIFLCHICNESGSALGTALGQALSVGVQMFFVISGFLHSKRKEEFSVSTAFKWYSKKLKRILIPLYVFLALLLITYVIFGLKVYPYAWLQTLIPICGLTECYISGCGHLWFLTHILICYLLTPFLQKIKPSRWAKIYVFPIIWLSLCLILSYTVRPIWCTLLNSIFSYCFGYYVLPLIWNNKRNYLLLIGCAALACGCRITARYFLDGTPLYNSVATQICSLALAVSIVTFIYQLTNYFEPRFNQQIKRTFGLISERTYTFYIVHWVFINGLLRINTSSNILNAVISLMLALLFSEIIYRLSDLRIRFLRKKMA